MKKMQIALGLVAVVLFTSSAQARGFGGFRGGGGFGGGGGFDRGGYGGGGYGGGFDRGGYGGGFDRGGYGSSYGGFNRSGSGGSYSQSFGGRNFDESGSRNSYSGWGSGGNRYAGSSYNRTWDGSHGGSVTAEGARGATYGPNGFAAGRERDVTATGPDGRTYSGGNKEGVAADSHGAVAGGSRYGVASGPGGTVAAGGRWGGAIGTDGGLARYSSFGAYNSMHGTAYWSHSSMAYRGNYVRTNFGYWGCFHSDWYVAHPGAWGAAVGWVAGSAWTAATWPVAASYIAVNAEPINYDYGGTVVYQNNEVYVNGADAGSASDYNQQAITLADSGRTAKPADTTKWQPLGVFALVQGEEKTSNTLFQLAVDPKGVIRGNYYDGLQDSVTPVYGQIDPKTQRAAWSIGDNKATVFEAGLFNLTNNQTPVLVHHGKDSTQQWLLVRVEKPKDAKSAQP